MGDTPRYTVLIQTVKQSRHFLIPFLCRFQLVSIVFPFASVCSGVHLHCQSHRFLPVLIGKTGVVLNIRKHRLV